MKQQNPGLIAKLLNKNSQPIGQGVHNGHPAKPMQDRRALQGGIN